MLAVDPVKRITVPEILKSSFFVQDLPRYLTPLPVPSGPFLGSLSKLVAPSKQLDFEMIDGLGRMEEPVVEQLASLLKGIDKEEIWDALRRDDGAQTNSVKVAYLMLRDKNRLGKNLAEYEEQERDAQLLAMDPANPLSPLTLSPGSDTQEPNPFELQFGNEQDLDSSNEEYAEDSDSDNDLEFGGQKQGNNIAILDTSLPGYSAPDNSSPHQLAVYANAKSRTPVVKEKKPHRARWHFGIRSRSPPMEVMAEIYRTLQTLGMEWKEKKDLGGLGGRVNKLQRERPKIERTREWDGPDSRPRVDLKAAAGIYLVECRIRLDQVVVRMNIQLYQVDEINYLVDFHHKRSYKVSNEPGATKFEMARPRSKPIGRRTSHDPSPLKEQQHNSDVQDHEVVSPFVFMDVACRLIIELAGGE